MNRKMKRFIPAIVMFLMLSLFATACSSADSGQGAVEQTPVTEAGDNQSNDEENTPQKQFSNEPATIIVATPWGEEGFMERIGNDMKEIIPNITINHVDWDGSVQNMEELNASNNVPDVVLAYSGQQPLEALDMVYPLEEMIKEFNVDLSGIQPTFLDEVRSRDKEARLVGIPQEVGGLGMFYNKEVFDLFGVPYPTENMTWDETLDLAKKMTVERDGIQYIGLEFGPEQVPLWQLSTTLTDPETGEVLLTKEPKIAKYMELMKKYYSIPGIVKPDSNGNEFMQKAAAMRIDWHGYFGYGFTGTQEEAADFEQNMDIVPVPSWTDLPELAPYPHSIHIWTINNYSEQKEAALQFIMASVSEDYQKLMSQRGTPSVLTSSEVNSNFGSEDLRFEGKNVEAFFQHTPATPPKRQSPWDSYVELDLKEFAQTDMNIAEFLRVAEEEAGTKIAEAMTKQ